MTERDLDDFAVGQTYGSGKLRVDADRIKSFAAEFDPQPFHLDDEAAGKTIFRGLAASGWHTAALTMRLLVEGELKPAGGIVAPVSTSSAGSDRCAPATNSASKAKCSKCARRNRVPSKA